MAPLLCVSAGYLRRLNARGIKVRVARGQQREGNRGPGCPFRSHTATVPSADGKREVPFVARMATESWGLCGAIGALGHAKGINAK